jgi:hypothetical protein
MRGRPIEKRTTESFTRDIEALGRLRLSLQLNDLPNPTAAQAIQDIDSLTRNLLILRNGPARPPMQSSKSLVTEEGCNNSTAGGSGEHEIKTG